MSLFFVIALSMYLFLCLPLQFQIGTNRSFTSVAFTPDGERCIGGTESGDFVVCLVRTLVMEVVIPACSGGIRFAHLLLTPSPVYLTLSLFSFTNSLHHSFPPFLLLLSFPLSVSTTHQLPLHHKHQRRHRRRRRWHCHDVLCTHTRSLCCFSILPYRHTLVLQSEEPRHYTTGRTLRREAADHSSLTRQTHKQSCLCISRRLTLLFIPLLFTPFFFFFFSLSSSSSSSSFSSSSIVSILFCPSTLPLSGYCLLRQHHKLQQVRPSLLLSRRRCQRTRLPSRHI